MAVTNLATLYRCSGGPAIEMTTAKAVANLEVLDQSLKLALNTARAGAGM